MSDAGAWLGQALLYAAFGGFLGLLSSRPTYEHLPPDRALIKLSFIHHGQRVQECRQRAPEELAKLPPNMRAPLDCPRERAPIAVEVDIDGAPALRVRAEPSGFAKDGAASVYERLETAAGAHRITVRLKDRVSTHGFDFERTADVILKPAQILVIDFDPQSDGITLQ